MEATNMETLLNAVNTLINSDEFCESLPGTSTRGRSIRTASLVDRQVACLLDVSQALLLLEDPFLYFSDVKAACILHGIPIPDSTSQADKSALSLIRHFLRGECYCNDSVGCFVVKTSESDGRQHLIKLFTALLTHDITAGLLRRCVHALTDTEADDASDDDARAFLDGYMNGIMASREPYSILRGLEKITIVPLTAFSVSHGLPTVDESGRGLFRSQLVNNIVRHICMEGCYFSSDNSSPAVCQSVANQSSDTVRLNVLQYAIKHKMQLRPIRRVLIQYDIAFEPSHTLRELRKIVKDEIRRLTKAKRNETRRDTRRHAHDLETAELSDLKQHVCDSWPQPIAENAKRRALEEFARATSSDQLREFTCAVCGCSKFVGDLMPELISPTAFDSSLLKGTFPEKAVDPFKDHASLAGQMLHCEGVITNGPTVVGLRMCVSCHKSLVTRSTVPTEAIANGLYLGDIPPELQDLTIVEEAMIARRRAKMWLIHLRSDTEASAATAGSDRPSTVSHTSTTEQRGMRGHVLVFPSEPKSLPRLLPPSLEQIAAPICVVFVGSTKPSAQWMKDKAKPLLVRKDKILAALLWLKQNNPLYADVEIDHGVMSGWDSTEVVPAEIHLQSPTVAGDAMGSRYDQPADDGCSCSGPCLCAQSGNATSNVVVTDVDGQCVTSKEMAAAALRHLKRGGGFISVPHGRDFVNEYEDHNLFPLLYPTLFPYGTGGFESPHRAKLIGMKKHVRLLISLSDPRFREHYSFLFTAFNILQRRQVSLGAKLKTTHQNFHTVCNKLNSVSSESIERVLSRIRNGLPVDHSSTEQRAVSGLLKEVSTVTSYVPGSAASRTKMRNEIRAMMFDLGMPSFFITINPADVYHPLVKFLAGSDIDIDNMLAEQVPKFREQAQLVAKNPFITAKFFDLYMKAFFKHIIGNSIDDGNKIGGVLGHTTGYYGCVEAQGRGTLHCHLLVWLEGSLNPQQIKSRILSNDTDFKDRLLAFIDDIIHNDIPADTALQNVSVPSDSIHPCSVRHVSLSSSSSVENHNCRRVKDVRNLVKQCQSHVHRNTCWKYWRGPPAPKECRFDLDASHHVPQTYVKDDGELEYRVLNGLINNFCPSILEAVRCNMDIKFIGSGASAKAILYYVTDYITKSPLKTHVAYEALQAAVRKLEGLSSEGTPDLLASGKRLLVRCANSLISKQQMSAPQVAAYLSDYEDHYSSHSFRSLYWQTSESYIRHQESQAGLANDNSHGAVLPESDVSCPEPTLHDEVVIDIDDVGNLEQHGNQCMDYRYRGDTFAGLCLWDFVATVDKVKLRGSGDRCNDLDDDNGDDEPVDSADTVVAGLDSPNRNTTRLQLRCGLQSMHPQSLTHFLRLRKRRYVPVPIGPSFPRRDREDCRERYSCLMLMLFQPWKTLLDLKQPDASWSESFSQFISTAPLHITRIIDNLQMLHECKDSRDDHYNQRRAGVRSSSSINTELMESASRSDDVLSSTLHDDNDVEILHDLEEASRIQSDRQSGEEAEVRECMSAAVSSGLFHVTDEMAHRDLEDPASVASDVTKLLEKRWMDEYASRREQTKRSMLAVDPVTEFQEQSPSDSVAAPSMQTDTVMSDATDTQAGVDATVTVAQISSHQSNDFRTAETAACTVADEFTLNEEQRLAFLMIAESSYLPRETPLRMFLGGAGGTGKSRVINALRSFFGMRNESRRFRLTSYTGVAAKNISGVTLHSALPGLARGKDASHQGTGRDAQSLWSGVDFLFVDEVSMVGCRFLSQISDALAKAKENLLPFGGLNVIFAGDFAQLRPVGDKPLYAGHQRTDQAVASSSTHAGQAVISGRLLWLGLNECVMLRQQMRQAGPENSSFRSLLNRLRSGCCTDDDFALLNSRVLSNMLTVPGSSRSAEGAPLITASNAVKDAYNQRAVDHFAASHGLHSHIYFAKDSRKGQPIADPFLKDWLLNFHSGKTDQRLGLLPLVIGMPVIITANYDVGGGVANGTDGILKSINYETDAMGCRYATSCVITVQDLSDRPPLSTLGSYEIVAIAEKHDLHFTHPSSGKRVTFQRLQLPVLPAFAMTDYKAQGRTLRRVILDIASCKTPQSPYVMLSRAVKLDDLFILRPFDKTKITYRQSDELRREDVRLQRLNLQTVIAHSTGSVKEQAQLSLNQLNARNSAGPSTDFRRTRHVTSTERRMQNSTLLDSIANLANSNLVEQ